MYKYMYIYNIYTYSIFITSYSIQVYSSRRRNSIPFDGSTQAEYLHFFFIEVVDGTPFFIDHARLGTLPLVNRIVELNRVVELS